MAKLKFGTMEVNMPQDTKQPDPAASEPEIDLESILKKLMEMMPKPDDQKPVDLLPLETKVLEQNGKISDLQAHVQALKERKPETVVVPEIKNITHVKDVSSDVLNQCQEMISKVNSDIAQELASLKAQGQRQNKINVLVCAVLALITILHFL